MHKYYRRRDSLTFKILTLNGKSDWNTAYGFLTWIGIAVTEDFHLEMSYVDSMLDVVPGEMKCN